MERRIRLNFKSLVLILSLATSCVCSNNGNVYYVRPISPPNADCPGDPCYSLNDYGTDDLEPPENNTVTMIFTEGYHIADSNYYNFGSPKNSHTLRVIGDRQSSNTAIVDKLETAIAVRNLILEGFIASEIYLYIDESVVGVQITNISILNCAVIRSTVILRNANLTIKDSNFSDSTSTTIILVSSTLTIVGHVTFNNNKGYQGGALMLVGTVMNIAKKANLLLQENYAEDRGGAIFVVHPQILINAFNYHYSSCFYQLLDYNNDSIYRIAFINNSAANGGDHIYGASLKSNCTFTHTDNNLYSDVFSNEFFLFDPGYDSSLSAVSADATRVCICDADGKPRCTAVIVDIKVYPGEQFHLPVVVVGGDYGTTTGIVYASFSNKTSTSTFGSSLQLHQIITTNSECSMLNFSVYSNESSELLFLTTQETKSLTGSAGDYYSKYEHCKKGFQIIDFYSCVDNEISTNLRNTPLFIDINLLPCPPGFILSGNPPKCHCHPLLTANGIDCILNNLSVYHNWSSTNIWMQAMNDSKNKTMFILSTHCPFSYCNPKGKQINLYSPNDQCAFNHAGILCGGCANDFSLAIGSSHCIHCLYNTNLALFTFFAVAGVLLVLIVAILNLTVIQGMINSLVFYANIVWAYQTILFPSDFGRELIVYKTFIAWLNLDFGIETCFFRGMNAYTKMWLQFIFPFYTAGLFFLGLRYSSKLSKLFGSRSVPTLATLLFLSYSKLLRTIIACLQLAKYYTYHDSNLKIGSISVVWAIDGNFPYGQYPHIFLVLAALACFILLLLPYALLLFSMQWLRTVDHLGPLKFIAKYKPIYDAYFAPLKDKHHYWFGLLLVIQDVLLLVSSLTLHTLPEISVLLLLGISVFLLCYVNSVRPYKRMSIALLESSFMVNFITLAVGYLYLRDNNKRRAILLSLSITVAIIEFCGIVIWNLIPKKLVEQFRIRAKRDTELDLEDAHMLEERHTETKYIDYHDSQTDDSKCSEVGTGIATY